MANWEISFDEVNVADGPYQDVSCGQTVEFIVGFYASSLESTSKTEKSVIRLGNAEYIFESEISYVSKLKIHLYILDIGFKVSGGYRDLKDVSAGSYLIGQAALFVDDENYWYDLDKDPNYPPMVYTWQINRILLDTTPYIDSGNKIQKRDKLRQSFLELDKTDIWEDGKNYDQSFPQYILHCSLLDIPPKFTLSS